MLTLPAAIGALAQAALTRIKYISTHTLAITSILTQISGLLTMAFTLAYVGGNPYGLFIGQCLYWIGGMTAASPTQEILAKAVSVKVHNQFFSRRAIVITVITLACNFASAKISENNLNAILLSQFILFSAFIRFLSAIFILRSKPITNSNSSFALEEDTKSNSLVSIVKLSLCICLFRFAVNISSPFFSAYILNGLGATLTLYAILTAIPLFVKIFCLNNWAKLLDENKKFEGLFIATMAIALGPILTGLYQNIPALAGLQILTGISWSGFDLISVLLIQNMYPRNITNKLGLFLAMGSIGSVVGGVLGGLHFNHYKDYESLFILSGVMRFATGFLLLWYLRRHHMFRFHELNLKHGLATLITVRPSLEAAAKLIPLPHRKKNG
ncbi:MAG: MFS transporter [Proteobacteria bacterium]|nr:MFS transporter [Pseudomonadota bacterium]